MKIREVKTDHGAWSESAYRVTLKTYTVTVKDAGAPPSASVRRSADLFKIAAPIFAGLDCDQEHFVIFTFDSGLRLQTFKVLSSGSAAQCLIDIRLVCRNALLLGASAVALAHNHPSGAREPSGEDRRLTARVRAGLDTVGVQLLEHLILCGDSYYSFADTGEMGGEAVTTPERA